VDNLDLSVIVERLEPGLTYQFQVRARNIYGYGLFSDISSIIPDSEPATMDAPVTTLAYPNVELRFSAPFYNGRSIDAYQIQIYSHSVADFVEETSVCDGSLA
jgi:hypothetical protein